MARRNSRLGPVERQRERIEYVGGPRTGESDERADLPSEIPGSHGCYVRSVRCADDGAMRYLWRPHRRYGPVRGG
jgi:hypothetical protein